MTLEISEKLRAVLSQDEEGQKLLSSLEEQAVDVGETSKKLADSEKRLVQLTAELEAAKKNAFDPELFDKLLSDSSQSPATGDEGWDSLTLSQFREKFAAELSDRLDKQFEELKKGRQDFNQQVRAYILQHEIDDLRERDEDFYQKNAERLSTLARENPHLMPRQVYGKLQQELKLAAFEESEATKRAAEEKAQRERNSFSENPDQTVAALQEKQLSPEQAALKAFELHGGDNALSTGEGG